MPRKRPSPKKSEPRKIRRRIDTKDRQKIFMQAYADTCNIMAAAKKAGITRATHYRWLDEEPEYRDIYTRTRHHAREYLESELVSRATKGWLEPVFYQGTRCGSVRRFDGSTGMALLRGMWP